MRKLSGGLGRHLWLLALALVAFLPFARGLAMGGVFYFRDLATQFFPLRRFVMEELRLGRLCYWNPYVHEGVPMALPPLSYPIDLLQAVLVDERGFSWMLALHIPGAALAFCGLARALGANRLAAIGGALTYAWGGFCLSSLNLYVYVEAMAWAPLVVWALIRAAQGDGRHVALAALASAVAWSTTGVEIVLQTLVFGVVLALPLRGARSVMRVAAGLVLGVGLASYSLGVMAGIVSGTARGAGFPASVVLGHSVHPITFLQVVVGGLFGDLSDLVNRWWGVNFFPRGFPYFLSLYLGLTTLCCASVGLWHGPRLTRRIAIMALLAGVVCLGRWAGLQPLVEALPPLRALRFPSKAFFTVHFSIAVLTSWGLQTLAGPGNRRAWKLLSLLGLIFGTALATAPGIPLLFPTAVRWWLGHFFPPDLGIGGRLEALNHILTDAATGGFVAVAVGSLALLVLLERLRPQVGATAVAALIAVDLLRSGAGLNPTVGASFYQLSPPMAEVARSLRAEGGRIFTLDVTSSPSYRRARTQRRHDHELLTFAALTETQTPDFNALWRLPSALSLDRTMLVPPARVLAPEDAGPQAVPRILPQLRAAGIAHLFSLDDLSHPDLVLRAQIEVPRLRLLSVRVYDLRDPLPLRTVVGVERLERPTGLLHTGARIDIPPGVSSPGRIVASTETCTRLDITADADTPALLVVRDAFAPGWSATVDGAAAPLFTADGRHRAVPIPAGRSLTVIAYRPPYLLAGLVVSLVCALLCVWLGLGSRRSGVTSGNRGQSRVRAPTMSQAGLLDRWNWRLSKKGTGFRRRP